MNNEKLNWRIAFKIKKYKDETAYNYGTTFDEKTIHGNLLLKNGVRELLATIGGIGGQGWTAGRTFIGVGSGMQESNRLQTGLQGANQQYKQILVGFPRIQENYIIDIDTTFDVCLEYSATFFGSEANFTWNEFSIASGTSATDLNRINLNRKLLDGQATTKIQGEVWNIKVAITLI